MTEIEKHILRTDHTNEQGANVAWCGARVPQCEWLFQDAEHAALTLAQGQRLIPCHKCAGVLRDLFREASAEIAADAAEAVRANASQVNQIK